MATRFLFSTTSYKPTKTRTRILAALVGSRQTPMIPAPRARPFLSRRDFGFKGPVLQGAGHRRLLLIRQNFRTAPKRRAALTSFGLRSAGRLRVYVPQTVSLLFSAFPVAHLEGTPT